MNGRVWMDMELINPVNGRDCLRVRQCWGCVSLFLTTAMQMLPRLAATSVAHRGPQYLLTLARLVKP